MNSGRAQRAVARNPQFVRDEILTETPPRMDDSENIPDQQEPQNSIAPPREEQEADNNDSETESLDQEEEIANTIADMIVKAKGRVPQGGQIHPIIDEIEEVSSMIEKTITSASAKINKLKKLRNNLESPSKVMSLDNSARNLVQALTTSI